MLLTLAVLAQAVSATPPERIDLTIPQPCSAQTAQGDEIVVCAPSGDAPDPYRINQPPPAPPPKAEVQLADGVSVAAQTESADVGGFPSNRALLRLKLKF